MFISVGLEQSMAAAPLTRTMHGRTASGAWVGEGSIVAAQWSRWSDKRAPLRRGDHLVPQKRSALSSTLTSACAELAAFASAALQAAARRGLHASVLTLRQIFPILPRSMLRGSPRGVYSQGPRACRAAQAVSPRPPTFFRDGREPSPDSRWPSPVPWKDRDSAVTTLRLDELNR